MEKENKCYYCDKLAIQDKRVVVDVEADHDIDTETGQEIWFSRPIYSTVGVCADHMDDDGDMREGEE
jgi:hypothetical protein